MSRPSNDSKFNVYRCTDPRKVNTDTPWYPISNVCPCDPQHNNVSGRGYTPCTFGITTDQQQISSSLPQGTPLNRPKPTGSLFQMNQYSPPQLDPRQSVRIENQWRNAF